MKLFNLTILKAVFVVLAAVGCGQALAFPFRVTKLTKGEGKEKITIWNIWDIHFQGKMDEKNAKYIIALQKKHNATLLLEDPFAYTGTNKIIKSRIKEVIAEISTENNLCHLLTHLSMLKNAKNTVNVETRHALSIGYNLPKEDDFTSIDNDCLEINNLYDDFCKKMENETNPTLKEFYKTTLTNVSENYTFKTVRNNCQKVPKCDIALMSCSELVLFTFLDLAALPNSFLELKHRLIYATIGFTNIKILIELFNGIKKGHNNFIIVSGGGHGEPIDDLLATKELEFTKAVLFDEYKGTNFKTDENQNNFIEADLGKLFQSKESPQEKVVDIKTKEKTTILSPKNILITGIITTGLFATAIVFGPTLWRWIKSKFE